MKPCQIHDMPVVAEPIGLAEKLWQRRNRIKRILKRRWHYLMNIVSEKASMTKTVTSKAGTASTAAPLQPGDLVRVRNREAIQATLNHWNQLNRCSFMEEMAAYCGTTHLVLKRVEKFLDERDYLMKKCRGIVILDGVFCEGTKDFGPCDRTCFFFWREEWLEKVG